MINLDRLLAQLLASNIQSTNKPLFQVITQLIKAEKELQNEIASQIGNITNIVNNLTFDGPAPVVLIGLDDSAPFDPIPIPGRDGKDGRQGLSGIPGQDGLDGNDSYIPGPKGLDGIAGLNGIPGLDGLDGEDGIPGIQGLTGATGATGATGVSGIRGADGLDGNDGLDGFPGATGATGSAGAAGAAGVAGSIGPPGMDGNDGEFFLIPGPAGAAGSGSSGAGLKQTFTGLQLRTSPDNDLANTTITIIELEQWTANDGTLVTDDLSNNTALITASGAGGLDTGSEVASVWYEIYRIRKSSDGTLNTLFHRALDWTSDTSFTTATNASRALRLSTSTATDKLAQGVTFASTKPFPFVDIQLIRAGAVSGNVWLTLESDTGGSPSGTVLATSDKINAGLLAASNQVIRLVFRTPYTPTATTQYHLVLQGDYTKSDTVNISWRGVAAGGYTGGSAKQYNGAAWSAATGVGDFYFNAYCEFNNAAVTMPSGYDQRCLLGYVYNDSGSNFDPFVQFQQVFTPLLRSSMGSFVVTIQTLMSFPSVLPPRPVMANVFGCINDILGYIGVGAVPDGFGPVTYARDYGIMYSFALKVDTTPFINFGPVMIEFQSIYASVDRATGAIDLASWEWF